MRRALRSAFRAGFLAGMCYGHAVTLGRRGVVTLAIPPARTWLSFWRCTTTHPEGA